MKRFQIGLMLLASFLLTSCIETQQIEKTGIIIASGHDTADNESLETTFVAFRFTPESKEMTSVMSGKGKTVKEALDDAGHASNYKLAPGKIRLTVFGKEMAEKGIIPILDTASRDARIPDLMYLSVSKTTAKELLSVKEDKIATDIGKYLHELVDNQTDDHNIPRKTLQDFLRIYYDIGQDNVLPIFEIQDDIPKLSSLALFKGDQMVGELTNDEAILINLMDRTVKEQQLRLSLPLEPFKDHLEERENKQPEKEVQVSFVIDKGKSKTKIVNYSTLVFQTDTTIKLRLLEQSAGIILKEEKVITKMENEVKKEMEARFEKLLTKIQKLEADPFGYGLIYKSSQKGKNLSNKEWREKFPTIQVNFNVDVEILQHGAID